MERQETPTLLLLQDHSFQQYFSCTCAHWHYYFELYGNFISFSTCFLFQLKTLDWFSIALISPAFWHLLDDLPWRVLCFQDPEWKMWVHFQILVLNLFQEKSSLNCMFLNSRLSFLYYSHINSPPNWSLFNFGTTSFAPSNQVLSPLPYLNKKKNY